VATVSLPDRASFEQLRNQAKDLQRAVRAGAPDTPRDSARRWRGVPFDGRARSGGTTGIA
jgi:hypothetical protein